MCLGYWRSRVSRWTRGCEDVGAPLGMAMELFPDIYLEVDPGWRRCVVAIIPSAGVVVILVVVVGFITAGQGEGDDAKEEDHAD